MKLVKQTENLAELLAETLTSALQNHRQVIWLVPGGSNIPISIEAMRLLDDELTERLVIMQTDERYVPADDPDCNWKQLRDGGFDVKRATAYPVTLPETHSLEMAVSRYEETMRREFEAAECIIGQFGIGPDGHTAGIKPHSAATLTKSLVSGYQAEDFTRITMTFPAIRRLDVVVTFAYGIEKRPVLERLVSDNPPPLEDMPAGILQTVANSTLYNDQIESGEIV